MSVTQNAALGADRATWPEFMTVGEIAAILRVSNMTVYRLVRSGSLSAIRAGRGWRVTAGSLSAYLDQAAIPVAA